MDVITGQIFVQWLRTRPHSQVAWCQVSRTTQEFRQHFTESFQRVLRRFTARDFRWVGLQVIDEFLGFFSPVSWQFTAYATFELSSQFRECNLISSKFLIPSAFFRFTRFFRIPLRIDFLRDFKRSVVPAQRFTGCFNFSSTQWSTVRFVRTCFVW